MEKEEQFVEMRGVVEVRYVALKGVEAGKKMAEDLIDVQKSVKMFPVNFCKKNTRTNQQNSFFCLVCSCPIMSVGTLTSHVRGKTHNKKVFMMKREVLGMEAQPMNTPRIKKIKMLPPIVDVGKTLADRLGGSGLPALGLEYVTEYFNPEDSRAHPMYMCSLEGCKSAWGTSDDTFHHVTNTKHLGNLQKKYCKSEGMMFRSRAEIQAWAVMEEEKEGGMMKRDYGVILKISNKEKYLELLFGGKY